MYEEWEISRVYNHEDYTIKVSDYINNEWCIINYTEYEESDVNEIVLPKEFIIELGKILEKEDS